jgi:hypothetical protein
MRRVVTSESPARAFYRAAVWSRGESALRECGERQYCESHFHLSSFAGDIYPRPIAIKTGRVNEVWSISSNTDRAALCKESRWHAGD